MTAASPAVPSRFKIELIPESRTLSVGDAQLPPPTVRVQLRVSAPGAPPKGRATTSSFFMPQVLDTSSSMYGRGFAMVKEASELLISDANVGAADTLALIPFDSKPVLASGLHQWIAMVRRRRSRP